MHVGIVSVCLNTYYDVFLSFKEKKDVNNINSQYQNKLEFHKTKKQK